MTTTALPSGPPVLIRGHRRVRAHPDLRAVKPREMFLFRLPGYCPKSPATALLPAAQVSQLL
jgi:hypothetical protein